MFITTEAQLFADNLLCTKNTAKSSGGVVYALNSEVTISHSTIRSNSALIGGAVAAVTARCTLRYSEFSYNGKKVVSGSGERTEYGGALYGAQGSVFSSFWVDFTYNAVGL
jgi:hypothetical protein